MTEVGAGGVVIKGWRPSKRFKKSIRKLSKNIRDRVYKRLDDLQKNPMPPGLGFEKLKGHSDPDIYTIHITGNFKVSMEMQDGDVAFLRNVGNHNEIDRSP
jgi:mRNA-degrading endonuclease RelE of RelBE toxin-antitoxin system